MKTTVMFRSLATLTLLCSIVVSAPAAIIWDYSPATTGANGNPGFINRAGDQNFLEHIQFAQDATITGMDIFSRSSAGTLGQSVTIRLFSDASGVPGTLITSFSENLDAVDTVGVGSLTGITRKYADFTTSLSLLANTTYWIGMSGTSLDLGQLGLNSNYPDDSRMYQLNVITPVHPTGTGVGDMAFRLHGDLAAVPEPSTYIAGALLLLPIGAHVCRRLRYSRQTS